jgi:hypothetical protein
MKSLELLLNKAVHKKKPAQGDRLWLKGHRFAPSLVCQKNASRFSDCTALRQTFDYFSLGRKSRRLEYCHSRRIEISQYQMALGYFYGRGERTQTFDLSVPNRARYQLRHTPKFVVKYVRGKEQPDEVIHLLLGAMRKTVGLSHAVAAPHPDGMRVTEDIVAKCYQKIYGRGDPI